MPNWLHNLIVVVGIVGCSTVIVLAIVSRVSGSDAPPELKSMAGSPRLFIQRQLKGRTRRQGRWAWNSNGETFYILFGVLWRVPPRWSLSAFNLVILDKAVNGDV